jgi:outer membrane biosynthesis protein TonB
MRLITPTDPEKPRSESETSESAPKTAPGAPLSSVPRDGDGALSQPQVRIRTGRYGELDEHELIHLLDSIEDERARGRFRESIYISLFIWIAIAWVVLYGPKYLWHAPKLVTPFEVLKQRELTQLNLPSMHTPPPSVPRPQPKVDNRTLEHLRSMEPPPRPSPAETPKIAPTPAPAITNAAPPVPAPALPLPNAPQPTPRATPPVVADAPTPQPSAKPNFNTNNSAESSIDDAVRNAARNPGGGGYGARGSGNHPLNMGGAEILSDTQGVNFDPYLRRLLADIYRNWLPLIPEEARPPLSKQGETLVRFRILPDGRIGGMWLDGSTHDDAINRSAWGSVTSEGQFPPLPSQFHGPNLELRIHYYVNKQPE